VNTTAEGVETREQLQSVLDHGCTEVQGYLFSRPLKAEDARAFLMQRHKGMPELDGEESAGK
jgi:EAL domain-containing protein (putative c-di-GMP-specific phosphodiesterase class I)